MIQIRRIGKAAIRSALKFSAHVANANGKSRHQAAIETRFLSGSSTLDNGHCQAVEEKINVFDPEQLLAKTLSVSMATGKLPILDN